MKPPYPGAEQFLPARHSLPALGRAVQGCRGCPLYAHATQAVFGAGPARATLLLVGEQPGNDEDIRGLPFVGPAGKLLDRALEEAGVDRDATYVTNAVKYFKWREGGTKRIHAKPDAAEIRACRPWVEAEIAAIHPRVLVALGATAAQSLLGRSVRVTTQHGKPIPSPLAPHAMATFHPSAILRQTTTADRHRMLALLVADLRTAGALVRTR